MRRSGPSWAFLHGKIPLLSEEFPGPNMKIRSLFAAFVLLGAGSAGFTQTAEPFPPSDTEAADKYAAWAKTAMDEGRWPEALAALERAADFADVSSDLSWLLALARSHFNEPRGAVLETLRKAAAVNRWRRYDPADALFMEAELLIELRFFSEALEILSRLPENAGVSRLRLLAIMNHRHYEEFFGEMDRALNRYPRNAGIARVYLEYLGKEYLYREDLRNPGKRELGLFNQILGRLPFLVDEDPELAWMAAPFIADREDARRLVAAYRAQGGAVPASLPIALRLGLIDEAGAIEEFFAPPEEGALSLDRMLITGIWDELRTEESRVLFRRNLSGLSGVIVEDTDRDGIYESRVDYQDGRITACAFDANQDGFRELEVYFEAGEPARAEWAALSDASPAYWPLSGEVVRRTGIRWERYPAVLETGQSGIRFIPRPGDFFFAPLRFVELPGGVPSPGTGLLYPERDPSAVITRRTMISFALRVERPSREFPGAVETVDLEGGIPVRATEYLEGRVVSVTGFFKGRPVTQFVDLNLDGRLETLRFFRQPSGKEAPGSPGLDLSDLDSDLLDLDLIDPFELLDYPFDFKRADSDWDGDGIFEESEYAPKE
jgi:tetratricopeptide (TPR) repeat protein